MDKVGMGLFILILLAFFVAAGGMSVCDYHSPRTDLTDLGISFSYYYYNDPYDIARRNTDAGQLSVSYTKLFDSPYFGYDLSLNNDMIISVLQVSSFHTIAEGNFKYYFNYERPYFGFAGVKGESDSSYETIGLSANVGIGYGRFTDVTPLVKAMAIDDYLLRKGSTIEGLHQVDLETIAHEIDSIETYDSVAGLLEALQAIIEGTGLTGGGLDALDVYKMGKIIEGGEHSRYCGGEAKLGLEYELVNPHGEPKGLLATVSLNYAFTTTPKAQFLVRAGVSGSYDIINTHQLDVALGYDYSITDTVSLNSSYSFAREVWGGESSNSHQLSLDFLWTPMESAHVTLSLSARYEPYYLEWEQEASLEMGMDLL
ncbi:MAG: hypothetical protein U9Q23_05345 [Candidatus Bipolaricaulota bacterium]|nr:hypothetical protein [Candidatus Bipolaricaulota bacterium]